jgi:hypothetical protein
MTTIVTPLGCSRSELNSLRELADTRENAAVVLQKKNRAEPLRHSLRGCHRICEGTRSEHGSLQLLGRRNVRNSTAFLHHHTNTEARERYAAHWREVTGFVVIVHRRAPRG